MAVAALLLGATTALGGISGATDRPADSANGWWKDSVTVTWTATDPHADPTPAAETVTQEGTSTHTSTACNPLDPLDCATDSVTVKVDGSLPTINANATPAANAFGWNNGTVTVSFPCSDAFSGIAAGGCPDPVAVANETDGMTVTGSVMDNVGHAASDSSRVIKIDKTKPTIAGAGRTPAPNANGWNNTNVTAMFTCGDPGAFASGVDPSAIDPDFDPTDDPSAVGSGVAGCPTVLGSTPL